MFFYVIKNLCFVGHFIGLGVQLQFFFLCRDCGIITSLFYCCFFSFYFHPLMTIDHFEYITFYVHYLLLCLFYYAYSVIFSVLFCVVCCPCRSCIVACIILISNLWLLQMGQYIICFRHIQLAFQMVRSCFTGAFDIEVNLILRLAFAFSLACMKKNVWEQSLNGLFITH